MPVPDNTVEPMPPEEDGSLLLKLPVSIERDLDGMIWDIVDADGNHDVAALTETAAYQVAAAVNHAPDLAEAVRIAIACAEHVALPDLDELEYMAASLAAYNAAVKGDSAS